MGGTSGAVLGISGRSRPEPQWRHLRRPEHSRRNQRAGCALKKAWRPRQKGSRGRSDIPDHVGSPVVMRMPAGLSMSLPPLISPNAPRRTIELEVLIGEVRLDARLADPDQAVNLAQQIERVSRGVGDQGLSEISELPLGYGPLRESRMTS
jgi:hypothetical protein